MTARYILLVFIWLGYGTTWSQADPSFMASTNTKQIALGQIFKLTYAYNNADIQDFSPPKLSNFKIVGGPNRSIRNSISNGRVASNISFSYSLLAQKLGTYTIPAAQIKVNDKKISSNTVKITVVKKKDVSNADTNSNENVFMRMEVSADSAYVGQQITIDYVLYSNVQTSGANVISEPDYTDFYVENPRSFTITAQRLNINDQIYESKIIQRISIFPQFPGEFNLEPIIANVRLLLEGGGNSPFSFFRPTRTVSVSSEATTIYVQSIPAEEPYGFTGAVGTYSIIPSVNRNKVKQNQAISYRIKIRGNGDPKKLKAPTLSFPEHVESYEPKLITDELTEAQGEIIGMRTYEYLLVPSEIGPLSLEYDLSYFDPETQNFVTADPISVQVEVTEGSAESEGEAVLFDQAKDLEKSVHNAAWKWGIPLAAFISLLGIGWLLKSKNKSKPIQKDIINWEERARKYLSTAQENIDSEKSADFYVSIRNGIYGYTAQKLNLPISELTQKKAIKQLQSVGVDHTLIEDVKDIIKKSELALFAGVQSQNNRQSMYDQALRLLGKLEEVFEK